MLFLLDTNLCSDWMRANVKVDQRLATLGDTDRAVICPIIRGELLYGIQRLEPGRKQQELLRKAKVLFSIVRCEPLPDNAGDHFALLKLSGESMRKSIDTNDLWIAATALAFGATLVTRDKVFSGLAGLNVEDWTL
jgi:tRNA(fMet)-specific endonuclease VapC